MGKVVAGRGVLQVYFDRLVAGTPTSLKLRLRADRAVVTKGVGSRAWLYDDPSVRALAPPVAVRDLLL